THRLTGVRAPTTTGKVERFHKTLRTELLATLPPLPSAEDVHPGPGRLGGRLQPATAAPGAGWADPSRAVLCQARPRPARQRRAAAVAAGRPRPGARRGAGGAGRGPDA